MSAIYSTRRHSVESRVFQALLAAAVVLAATSVLRGNTNQPLGPAVSNANQQVTTVPGQSAAQAGQAMLGVMVVNQSGTVVTSRLYVGGPAHRAGIRPGDVILSINGQAITTDQDLIATIGKYRPYDRIELLVKREGWTAHMPVILGDRTIVAALRTEVPAQITTRTPLVRESRSYNYSGYDSGVEAERVLDMYDPYRRALYTAFGP